MVDDLSSDWLENLPKGVPFYRVDVADAGGVNEVLTQLMPTRLIRATVELDWVAGISLEEGLRRTAAWFVSRRESLASTGV